MSKSAESAAKKDTQKLQRAIVDGLEDVKAQDIKVFDTEALSALFERVIIASGTSNRQTKALAASVRDKVKAAGFAPPRVEGEDNGEWIIVDCGQVVAHIMQPTFRQYYHLEELWGDKPVRLKIGAALARPAGAAAKTPSKTPAKSSSAKSVPSKPVAAKPAPAKKAPARKAPSAKTAAGQAAKPVARKPKSMLAQTPAKATARTARSAAGPAKRAAPRG
jgi:ribosome-associated protein